MASNAALSFPLEVATPGGAKNNDPAGAQSRVGSTHLRGRRPNRSAPPGGGSQNCGPTGPAAVLSVPGQPWVPSGRLTAVAGVVGGVDPASCHLLDTLEEVAHVRAAEALGPPRCEAVGRPRVREALLPPAQPWLCLHPVVEGDDTLPPALHPGSPSPGGLQHEWDLLVVGCTWQGSGVG